MSRTTAAEAAEKATRWAHSAEEAHKFARENNQDAATLRHQRNYGDALAYGASAAEWEQVRSLSVDMATMWANVATALQGTEPGGRS